MTIKAFKYKVLELGGTIESDEPYNSNNDWGFGGLVGRIVKARLGELQLSFKHGQLCYRHLPEEHEDNIRVNDHTRPFGTEYFFKLYARGAHTFEELIRIATHERNAKGA